jgi:hypothetical protein
MAIHLARQFYYEAIVRKTAPGVWGGQAAAGPPDGLHPGLAGDRPRLEVTGGAVILHRTEPATGRLNPDVQDWKRPVTRVAFRIGQAVEAVIHEGDVLSVLRGGTTDLGLALTRSDEFIIGLGAIDARRLRPGITIEEDPRAAESDLYHLAEKLDDPETTLAWLDASDPHADAALERLPHLPGRRLVVAVTGKTPEERREVIHRAAEPPLGPTHGSHEYLDVPPEFTTPEQWVAYLRQLPKTRPRDLYIRFNLEDHSVDVREGEYAFSKPWHLYVAKVHKPGIPGEWSQLGIAREHPAITRAILVESTNLIATRVIDIAE